LTVRAGRAGTGLPGGPPAAATELEARACGPDPAAVIGGANSAAQAALYLAGHGNAVTLIVRGNDLAAGMSSYLADRILAHARITVRTATEVTALHGGSHLEAITVHTAAPGDDRSDSNQPCRGLPGMTRAPDLERMVDARPHCAVRQLPCRFRLGGMAVSDEGQGYPDDHGRQDDYWQGRARIRIGPEGRPCRRGSARAG
jgi:Pyridine nucleotide-disulphide oxidoreductase